MRLGGGGGFAWSSAFVIGLVATMGLSVSCSKQNEAQTEKAAPSGIPPLEGASKQEPVPGGRALPPGHPPIGKPGAGKSAHAGDPFQGGGTIPAAGGPAVEGEIALSPTLKQKAKVGTVLFLSIRQDQGGTPGQVLAVDRFEAKALPVRFSVDASKAMVPGTSFAGDVLIMARIDQDGDAMTKSPGDLQGMAKARIPAKDVRVTIDTVLP